LRGIDGFIGIDEYWGLLGDGSKIQFKKKTNKTLIKIEILFQKNLFFI